MTPLLLAALLWAQHAEQPSKEPIIPAAQLQPGGTGTDVEAAATLILELDEGDLRVTENWSLENRSPRRIEKEALVITYPGPVKRFGLGEGVMGWKSIEGANRAESTEAMGSGEKKFSAGFFHRIDGGTANIRRPLPFNMAGVRVIIEEFPGTSLSANFNFSTRISDLNGIRFSVYEFNNLPAGSVLDVTVTGLPSRPQWPRMLAVVLALSSLGWMAYVLLNKRMLRERAAPVLGALSAEARRDQIVKALELLERDKKAETIKDKRYDKRHAELMSELASVLREIDLARSAKEPSA